MTIENFTKIDKSSSGKRALPLKIFVQTIWVVLDDETGTVIEQTDGGVTIPAAEWPTFYEKWAADFATLQENVASPRLET